ncbi:DNA translocase FtsK [Pseudomonas oryzihabitans]|uniref:DNA translocase FtsK n=1 Tax=Pseudomonas oryzihabitans TaxID=47885 RepID=UPI00289D03F5|nr:DNA translocase FtsK [Pseudomonas oryzihabitans]
MKPEHRAIIDNAKRHGCMPSELAHELLVHDLVEMARFELHNLKAPYHKLNEEAQQEVINRLTEKAEEAVTIAVRIITARGAASVPIEVRAIKVEAKALTVTAKVDATAPDKHELTDSAGKLCLLVLAPDDYREGLDAIQPERDQHEMPMQVADLLGSPEELAERLGGSAEDVATAAGETVEQQDAEPEEFGAAAQPEAYGVVPYSDVCAVLARATPVVTIDYLQSRFAIGSDAARALVVRLLDDKVIAVQSEAENPLHNTYRVTKDLDEVVSME